MNGSVNGFVIVLVVLVVLGAGVGIAFAVRRHRYVKALRARGWSFESSPSPAIANGLIVPPFGVGFARGTDEQVYGRTRSGVDFQVFEYAEVGDSRVVCMTLPMPLPEVVVLAPNQVRQGLVLPPPQPLAGGAATVQGTDPAAVEVVLQLAGGALAAFGARYPLNLALDGDQLTQVGAPKDPDELEAYLEALAPVVQALHAGAAQLESFRQPEPQPRLGFYHRPSWYYLPSDDGVLATVDHTRNGHGHRTSDVVHGEMYPGCWFVALVHHWQTTRTETYTDGNGNTQTRTVTENHEEVIHEVTLSFGMPDLTVTTDSRMRRLFNGRSLDFELAAFNDAYDVYCDVPKFAYDVLHPRQIEYLMGIGAMPFDIVGSRVRPRSREHSPQAIAYELDVLAGFFARIPPFVWQDLGVAEPPLRLTPAGQIEVRTA